MLADRVRMATFKDGLPKGYVLATDDDFNGSSNGWFRYRGSNLKIVIPHVIKGIAITSYRYIFNSTIGPLVEGVISNNPNITDMSYMFSNSKVTTLDLSSFDTSNVTDMIEMFSWSMATTLDLSSFDTSNVTDMSNMFWYAEATTGYARTQADANRFNASSNKPSRLTFRVKP